MSLDPAIARGASAAAGAKAALAAQEAAKVARNTGDVARAAAIRTAAHAAVSAAQRTETDGSVVAGMRAAAAAQALADTVPASDTSTEAQNVRGAARDAQTAVVQELIGHAQSLYTALQALRRDVGSVTHDVDAEAADIATEVDGALEAVSATAAAFGGHVSGVVGQEHPPTPSDQVARAIATVRSALASATRLSNRMMRAEMGTAHAAALALATTIQHDIDRANSALQPLSGAALAGIGGIGIVVLVLGLGALWALNSHHG